MPLAFAAFQPWVVAFGLAVSAIGFGGCAWAAWYVRRRQSRDVLTLLMAATAVIAGFPVGIAGGFVALYGLDLSDSVGR